MSSPLPSEKTFSPPRVFVVDDDPDICRIIVSYLEDAGYECETFGSARTFLDKLDLNVAGCLLLDIRMPEMNGLELQSILADRGWGLPIIFLSAAADVPIAVQVMQRGAVNIIKKPFKREVLVQAVRDAIAIDAAQRPELLRLNDLRRRLSELTPREREVADFLAGGNSNKQTAAALDVSERTVEIHRSRVMAKMGCDSIVTFGVQWDKLRPAARSDVDSSSSPHARAHGI